MNPYSTKSSRLSRGRMHCINPHCRKWSDLYCEKICPRCGKRSVMPAGRQRCDHCSTMLISRDVVCPLCGSKQRTTVELRGIHPGKLTAFTHLLREAKPGLSLDACRSICRNCTKENPFRISFANCPDRIRPFLQKWHDLGGTAAACLDRETSTRPIVLLRSYNCRHPSEHMKLLFQAVRKTTLGALSHEETARLLHSVNREDLPCRLVFTSGFDEIDAWVAAWRKLGGTAVHSSEHELTIPRLF